AVSSRPLAGSITRPPLRIRSVIGELWTAGVSPSPEKNSGRDARAPLFPTGPTEREAEVDGPSPKSAKADAGFPQNRHRPLASLPGRRQQDDDGKPARLSTYCVTLWITPSICGILLC